MLIIPEYSQKIPSQNLVIWEEEEEKIRKKKLNKKKFFISNKNDIINVQVCQGTTVS
jgi:hypothetical protein